VKNTLVLSTADAALSDLIGGRKASEVEATFSSGALKGVSAPLILFYTSGERVGNFIESLQASMAMFTGGQPLVEPEDMKSIRSIGTIGTAVSFGDDALRVQTSYLPEKTAKQLHLEKPRCARRGPAAAQRVFLLKQRYAPRRGVCGGFALSYRFSSALVPPLPQSLASPLEAPSSYLFEGRGEVVVQSLPGGSRARRLGHRFERAANGNPR
jgi:hypothetical protein